MDDITHNMANDSAAAEVVARPGNTTPGTNHKQVSPTRRWARPVWQNAENEFEMTYRTYLISWRVHASATPPANEPLVRQIS